jgi:ribosomal protein L10
LKRAPTKLDILKEIKYALDEKSSFILVSFDNFTLGST